jgi:hypothetical protein
MLGYCRASLKCNGESDTIVVIPFGATETGKLHETGYPLHWAFRFTHGVVFASVYRSERHANLTSLRK